MPSRTPGRLQPVAGTILRPDSGGAKGKSEFKSKAWAMREAGYSYAQIAEALGVGKGTVWNWLHEA